MRGTVYGRFARNGLRRFIGVAALAALAAVVWTGCGGGDSGTNPKPRVKQFTVDFDTNGGTPDTIPSAVVDSGATLGAKYPDDPTKADSVFAGWFHEEVQYTDTTIITENVTLTAMWEADDDGGDTTSTATYKLTTNVIPAGGGTVSRSPDLEDYEDGTEVTLTAEPADGYEFTGWSGASTSVNSTVEVTMSRNLTLTARFAIIEIEPDMYKLTTGVTPENGGTVSRSPNLEEYEDGTTVTVKAVAAAGYAFTGWSGASVSEDSTITVTMDEDKELTANFEVIITGPDTYTLTVSATPAGSGTALRSPSQSSYNPGTRVSVTATPASGYEFVNWTLTGTGSTIASATSTSTSVTVNANTTVVANFRALPKYKLTVNTTPTGGGTVTRSPNSADSSYVTGTQVTLTARAATGYNFSGWTGGVTSTDAAVTVTMTADTTLTANFERINYTLTINQVDGGTVTRDPDQESYPAGTVVTVTAKPDEGYGFEEWIGASTSQNPTITVTMNGNLTLTPYFGRLYALTVIIEPENGGTVSRSPDQPYYSSETLVKLTATAAQGYVFRGWSWSIATNPVLEINLYDDMEITANFAPKEDDDEEFVDDRDGKRYRTVLIGGKRWMAENLNYEHETSDSWCYDDEGSNCDKYGRLYTWDAAMANACPAGWHVPTSAEWTALLTAVGGVSTAGTKLKAESGWEDEGDGENGTDDFGFSALPGGERYPDGSSKHIGIFGNWWSATESVGESINAVQFNMGSYFENVSQLDAGISKTYGYSLRCVQDD